MKTSALIFVAPLMLFAGLSMGAGASTLYWSGRTTHMLQLVRNTNAATEQALQAAKEWKRASGSFEKTATECLAILQSRDYKANR